MADRNVTFKVTAKDDTSSVLKAVGTNFEELRRKLSLPITGPLTREQATIERAAISRLSSQADAKTRAALDKALGIKGGEGGGVAGLLAKFGLSSGTDAFMERFAKAAPTLAFAAAATKLGTFGFRYLNFRQDVARHNASMNLERQLADEQASNEFKRGVPLVGELSAAVGEYFNLRNYRSDKEAIERLEDATKAQEAYTGRLKSRYEIEKALIDNAKQLNNSMALGFAQRGATAERADYLSALNVLQLFNKKLEDAGFDTSGGVRKRGKGEVYDDLEEQQSNLQRAAQFALLDSFKADFARVKNFGQAFVARMKDLPNAFRELRAFQFGEADRKAGNQDVFRSLEADSLQRMIGLGDKAKELDLERLHITQQTVAAKRPLLEILRQENASIEDKSRAQAGLDYLTAQEDILRRGVGFNNFRGATAPGDFNAALLTGKAQATREESRSDPLLKELQALRQQFAEVVRNTDNLARIASNPTVVELFKGLFGSN